MAKIIKPDDADQSPVLGYTTVFLAGSIDNGKATLWANQVQNALADQPVVIYNPAPR